MKKIILLVASLWALSVPGQTNLLILVHLPWAPGDPAAGTNAPYWLSNTAPSQIEVWQWEQADETNFCAIAAAVNGLLSTVHGSNLTVVAGTLSNADSQIPLNGSASFASGLITLSNDGSASFANGQTWLNADGSGSSAGGLLSWDASGNLTAPGISGGSGPANSFLNSFRVPAWTTNSISLAAGASNAPVWVTNLAELDYTVTLGAPRLFFSFDGSNYVAGSKTLITNVAVKIMFFSGLGIDTNQMAPTMIPMPAALTNVTYWQLSRPDLFGTTNALYGEKLLVSEPGSPWEAASKNYVDQSVSGTQWWSAKSDVQLNSYPLHFNFGWSEFIRGGQANTLHMSFLGQDAYAISYSAPASISNALTATVDGTGTNVVVSLATNGVSSSARLMFSHQLMPLNWQLADCAPALVDDTWIFTVPFPWPDAGFMMAVIPSADPGVMTLNIVLQGQPRTITTAASTTWGYGAGLLCSDSEYIYVSVATNSWKRVALSAW